MLKKDARIATAQRTRYAPSLDEAKHLVVAMMPQDTEIQQRNRAAVAFLLLTGVRDGAAASLKLGDVDLANRYVFQDARHVKTKNSKSIPTYFFPCGDEILGIVGLWITHLRLDRGFTDSDPLFPATLVLQGTDRLFSAKGVGRKHWESGATICKIVSDAAAAAGLPHFTPHALRTTLGLLGLSLNLTAEQWKAYSQNFGHEHLETTFTNYSPISPNRQGAIMRALDRSGHSFHVEDSDKADKETLARLRLAGLKIVLG